MEISIVGRLSEADSTPFRLGPRPGGCQTGKARTRSALALTRRLFPRVCLPNPVRITNLRGLLPRAPAGYNPATITSSVIFCRLLAIDYWQLSSHELLPRYRR